MNTQHTCTCTTSLEVTTDGIQTAITNDVDKDIKEMQVNDAYGRADNNIEMQVNEVYGTSMAASVLAPVKKKMNTRRTCTCTTSLEVTADGIQTAVTNDCLLYTSPSPRDATLSRMPSSA